MGPRAELGLVHPVYPQGLAEGFNHGLNAWREREEKGKTGSRRPPQSAGYKLSETRSREAQKVPQTWLGNQVD